MTVQVIEHSLPKEWQNAIEYALTGASQFPWQFQPLKVTTQAVEPWNSQFTHLFYSDGVPVTPFWEMVVPILEVLDPLSLLRIKANLTVATENTHPHEWHTDSDDTRLTSCVYYANTTNGFTEFEDGTRIDCMAGTLITFPSSLKHRTWTHTDVQARAVINTIYLAR